MLVNASSDFPKPDNSGDCGPSNPHRMAFGWVKSARRGAPCRGSLFPVLAGVKRIAPVLAMLATQVTKALP